MNTSEMKHTPGPWWIDRDIELWVSGDGRDPGHPVCMVTGGHVTDRDLADAHLIASAPDMLDALKNAAGLFDTPVARRWHKTDVFYEEAIASIRDAIARAEGRTP
jgi:hypothetical protein